MTGLSPAPPSSGLKALLIVSVVFATLGLGLRSVVPAPRQPATKLQAADELRWFKGNIHTHSHWSDGNDYLESIAVWYRDRGYNFLTFTDPEPHRRVFLKPFMRQDSSEFCSSCHKVHLDVPVNNYRWLRGFNDYDNWQASGVSGQGARSFYYPDKPMGCSDCHMPLVPSRDPGHRNGMIHNHRFAAANSAVPFVNGDQTQLKAVEGFLKSGFISVDIFAAAPAEEAPGVQMMRRAGAGSAD